MKRLMICLLLLMLPCAVLADGSGLLDGATELEHLNKLRAVISCGGEMFSESVETASDEMLPVYSAPSEKSWRAANGKAAVSLRDTKGLRTFGMMDGWQLVEYMVDQKTSRIGYIQKEGPEINDAWHPTEVWARSTTYLTDDPDVSRVRQMTIPEGTPMTALDCYGSLYAYVETELDGQAIRGFVPLEHLELALTGSTDEAAVNGILGAWRTAGEWITGPHIVFDSEGQFASYDVMEDGTLTRSDTGEWQIVQCDPERFNNGSTNALLLAFDDGRAAYVGLTMDGDSMILDTEAGMIFERVADLSVG